MPARQADNGLLPEQDDRPFEWHLFPFVGDKNIRKTERKGLIGIFIGVVEKTNRESKAMTCTAKELYRWMTGTIWPTWKTAVLSRLIPADQSSGFCRCMVRFLMGCSGHAFYPLCQIMSDGQFESGNWRISAILVMKISGYRDSYSNPGPKDGERMRMWSDTKRILPFRDQCTFEENRVSVYHIVLVCLPNVS